MRSDLLRTPPALLPPLQTMSNPVPGTASESAAVLGVAPASIMVKRADVVAVSSSTRMVIPLRLDHCLLNLQEARRGGRGEPPRRFLQHQLSAALSRPYWE